MANCPVTVPVFVELDCFKVDKGRIVGIAFIDESHVFVDTSDPAEWVDANYAADILVHKQVRGGYAPSSISEAPGYGKQASRTVGRNHEVIVHIPSMKGNSGYWDALNKAENYKFAFVTGEYDDLYYVNTLVQIDAKPGIEEGLDSQIDWVVSIKWSDLEQPSITDVPAGIFE